MPTHRAPQMPCPSPRVGAQMGISRMPLGPLGTVEAGPCPELRVVSVVVGSKAGQAAWRKHRSEDCRAPREAESGVHGRHGCGWGSPPTAKQLKEAGTSVNEWGWERPAGQASEPCACGPRRVSAGQAGRVGRRAGPGGLGREEEEGSRRVKLGELGAPLG